MLVDFTGTRSLEISYEVADRDMRFDVDGEMDVSLRAADGMKIDAVRLPAAITEKIVDLNLKLRSQERIVVLGVPGEV